MIARLAALKPAALVLVSLGLLGLGTLNIVFHDLLLQWQPAKPDAQWRGGAAVASGALLIGSSLLLMWPGTRRLGAIVAVATIGAWTALLHGPVVGRNAANVGAWLGLAESGAMAMGIAFLLADNRALRMALGACFVVFGLSHFVYPAITASMVPGWLPAPLILAYLTGAIHALTGACLLVGLAPPLASAVEGAMMGSFALLVHVPRVIANPIRIELTMLFVAILLTASALLAASVQAERRASPL